MANSIKWWKLAGLLASYAMFWNIGATLGIAAFLFGFVFGDFWANRRNQTNNPLDLTFLIEAYFVMAFPIFVIIWSSAYLYVAVDGASKLPFIPLLLVSIAAILLLYLSYFFRMRVIGTQDVSHRLRWCINLGPTMCGGMTGLAGLVLAIGSYLNIPEPCWWISITLLFSSLVPAIVFVILFVLLTLDRQAIKPPPPRQAVG